MKQNLKAFIKDNRLLWKVQLYFNGLLGKTVNL